MIKVVGRRDWRAQEPAETKPLLFPIRSVLYKYTETEKCHTEYECSKMIRGFQQTALDKGLPDLPYNFLVGGDLSIYEGRGWDSRVFERKLVVGYIARESDDDQLIEKMNDMATIFLRSHENKVRIFIQPEQPEQESRPRCNHGVGKEWFG